MLVYRKEDVGKALRNDCVDWDNEPESNEDRMALLYSEQCWRKPNIWSKYTALSPVAFFTRFQTTPPKKQLPSLESVKRMNPSHEQSS